MTAGARIEARILEIFGDSESGDIRRPHWDARGKQNAPEVSPRGALVLSSRTPQRGEPGPDQPIRPEAKTANSSRATMLVILIIGFTAGPAVSL